MLEQSRSTAPLIAIEGCVGAGKTTIACGLAKFRKSRLLLEDCDAVPFLSEFYKNPTLHALETEFAFLLHHYHKLNLAYREQGELVSDFALSKDILFADLNMGNGRERKVFYELYELLALRIPKVAATVFISISDELVISRIQKRNRAFEMLAPHSYYHDLNATYERFFASYSEPLIKITAETMDFCKEPHLFAALSAQVDAILNKV